MGAQLRAPGRGRRSPVSASVLGLSSQCLSGPKPGQLRGALVVTGEGVARQACCAFMRKGLLGVATIPVAPANLASPGKGTLLATRQQS